MKAICFTLNRKKSTDKVSLSAGKIRRYSKFSLKVFLKKYGIAAFFITILLFGMVFGSIYAGEADESLYKGLDFLFTTNLSARLSQGFLQTFCACFASNFVFIALLFLLGITPWGIPLIPFVCFFKGFGAGVSGGYIVEAYSLTGFLFYIAVLLPGLFAFCLCLIAQSNLAFYNSKRIFSALFVKNSNITEIREAVMFYLQRSLTLMMISLGCAVLDTLLWCLLAPLFGFI